MKIRGIEDLEAIKERSGDLTMSGTRGKTRVILGMGTCGIAAGAHRVEEVLIRELKEHDLSDVVVEYTGCIGMCQKEPLLDVVRPGEPRITYGPVAPEDVPRIVAEHVAAGVVVEDKSIGRID